MSTVNGSGGAKPGGLADIMALRQQILERSEALQQARPAQTGAVEDAKSSAPTGVAQANGPLGDFADTLSGAVDNVSAIQKRSSDMAAAYERGEVTDVTQVMLARQESSVAFEATLQVRNKLLSAYQEIMRMGG